MAFNALTIIQALIVLIALGAAAFAFRAKVSETTDEANHRAVSALQDAVEALEKKLEHTERHYQAELQTRDKQIAKLEAEINALKGHIGIEAEQRVIKHIDRVGDRIVSAIDAS
jgi:peptidoglycan hydrolase CwlO-like protein